MQLTEKYRPKTFEDFRGSDLVRRMLQTTVEQGNVPNCLMFSGPKGVGKTSMARILDRALNGEDSALSYMEVDAASHSGVDNIRKLQETIRYSHPNSWRLVVLDEAHNLSNAAFNALLKILEDPPNRTSFILITTKPETIPDTVKSRATPYRFSALPKDEILRRLAEITLREDLPIKEAEVLRRIAETSEGSLRTAIVTLQQILQAPEATVEMVNHLTGYTVNTTDLMYAMLSGDLGEVEVELAGVFSGTGDIDKFFKSLVDTLKEFHASGLVNNAVFLSCMGVVWNMRKVQRSNDGVARTQMEAGLFAMFAQNFWNGDEGTTKAVDTAITAQDLQSLAS